MIHLASTQTFGGNNILTYIYSRMYHLPLREGICVTGVPFTSRIYSVYHNTVGIKRRTWNRDINAAHNIFKIVLYYKIHGDYVPEVFRHGYVRPHSAYTGGLAVECILPVSSGRTRQRYQPAVGRCGWRNGGLTSAATK